MVALLRSWDRLSLVYVEECEWLLIGSLLSDIHIVARCLMVVHLLQVLHVVVSLYLSKRRGLNDPFLTSLCRASLLGRMLLLNDILELLRRLHLRPFLWSLAEFRLPSQVDSSCLEERRVVEISIAGSHS